MAYRPEMNVFGRQLMAFRPKKTRLPPASRGITIYETAGQVSGYPKIGWFAMYI